MANEPTIRGTSSTGYPAGWNQLFDYQSGATVGSRIRLIMGPVSTIDAAILYLKTALNVADIEPSVSAGSAVASIRCTYSTSTAITLVEGETRPPLFQITPLMETVDIRAHPKAQLAARYMPAIDRYLAAGDLDGLHTYITGIGGDTATVAAYIARFLVAGVTHFEAAAISLTVTRYYDDPPTISSDYAAINKASTWAAISTDSKSIPSYVQEPKWIDYLGTAKSFEWRLISVSPTIQRGSDNIVTWTYIGRQYWAKELYSGGTWEPEALW